MDLSRFTYLRLTLANLETDSVVLDFFSGSATTADATQLNAEDNGNRKFYHGTTAGDYEGNQL